MQAAVAPSARIHRLLVLFSARLARYRLAGSNLVLSEQLVPGNTITLRASGQMRLVRLNEDSFGSISDKMRQL
jgi:hypothetical protein